MPVTEFALFHLKQTEQSPATKSSFQDVITEQSAWSKYPVHFLRQKEDPAYVYLLGGWASVAEHFGDWITSEPNQRLLAELKDKLSIEWLFHLDIDVCAGPPGLWEDRVCDWKCRHLLTCIYSVTAVCT